MKTKTLVLIKNYLEEEKILFHEDKPEVSFYLSSKEIKDLIKIEYGYNTSKESTQAKYLSKLSNSVLQLAIDQAKLANA